MGKSSGSTASGGGGSAAGIISSKGGLMSGASYNRDPGSMKGSDRHLDAAYEGTNSREATAIATGKADVKRNPFNRDTRIKPVDVEVYTDRSGRHHVDLTDGRHRALSAKRAGATHIRARITRVESGKPDRVFVRSVRL